jgi:hypothetical protein
MIITDDTYTNTIKYLIKYVEPQFITCVAHSISSPCEQLQLTAYIAQ